MSYENNNTGGGVIFGVTAAALLVVAVIVGFFMWVLPNYSVWERGMAGRAELSQADYNRQVQVVNAQANLQAQKFNADAEVVRASGVAKANNIIKDSITSQYIDYLWVQTLENSKNEIIYVPEGPNGLPLSEAGRAVTTQPQP